VVEVKYNNYSSSCLVSDSSFFFDFVDSSIPAAHPRHGWTQCFGEPQGSVYVIPVRLALVSSFFFPFLLSLSARHEVLQADIFFFFPTNSILGAYRTKSCSAAARKVLYASSVRSVISLRLVVDYEARRGLDRGFSPLATWWVFFLCELLQVYEVWTNETSD
jgi:hypothetical protein